MGDGSCHGVVGEKKEDAAADDWLGLPRSTTDHHQRQPQLHWIPFITNITPAIRSITGPCQPASSARDHEMVMMLMLVMRYTKRELLVRWFLPLSPAMVSRRRRIITYMGSKMVRIMRGSLSILRRLLFLCTRNCNMESARVRLLGMAGWLLTDWLIGNAVV